MRGLCLSRWEEEMDTARMDGAELGRRGPRSVAGSFSCGGLSCLHGDEQGVGKRVQELRPPPPPGTTKPTSSQPHSRAGPAWVLLRDPRPARADLEGSGNTDHRAEPTSRTGNPGLPSSRLPKARGLSARAPDGGQREGGCVLGPRPWAEACEGPGGFSPSPLSGSVGVCMRLGGRRPEHLPSET